MTKLFIIGGGPAGLAAAIRAAESGVDPSEILILERDSVLGGILNQCIHAGFGLHLFGEELSGPQYALRFIRRVTELNIPYRLNSMALSVARENGELSVCYVSPQDGFVRARASAVILATGCRERTRGAISIAGTRPAGVFTAGSAQRFVNIEGVMPGKRVVILGSGDIGLIMARRMTLEGADVRCVCEVMPYSGGLGRNIAQCLDDFDIPLRLSHTVTEICGRERVTGVRICPVDENRRPIREKEEYIECDTLLLSVGLIPENELARGADVKFDRVTGGAVVSQFSETSVEGVYACGNALQVHDLVDFVTMEAYGAGKSAAKRVLGENSAAGQTIDTVPSDGVRYVVPQRLDITALAASDENKLFFRTDNIHRNVRIEIFAGDKVLYKKNKPIVTPGEMESVALDAALCDSIKNECASGTPLGVRIVSREAL